MKDAIISFAETFRYYIGVAGIIGLIVFLNALGLYFFARNVWEPLRRWWSLQRIEGLLVAAFVCGMVFYGSTKSSFQFDEGLTDAGSWTTNDLVHIAWHYGSIPSASTVYIDYRRNDMVGNPWENLAETTAASLEWDGHLADATNYDFWVYSTYIPPVPVHTNGVWVGNAYRTKTGKGFVVTNSRITDKGKVIATPEQVKRAQEEDNEQ